MILYVGATGRLGRVAVAELVKRGFTVRCLLRNSADAGVLQGLEVEIMRGDATDSAAVSRALAGVTTIISSFAADITRDPSVTNLWANDYAGNLNLIERGRAAGVHKFVFVSYWGLVKSDLFVHGRIKKLVEDLLRVSGMDYTILRVTTLATDMSQLTGKSLARRGWAPCLMRPTERIRPVLLEDLAWCMAESCVNARASCATVDIGGAEEYTFRELEQLFCRAIGRRVRLVFIPPGLAAAVARIVDALTGCRFNARGLVAAFTGGSTCDIAAMNRIFAPHQGSFARHLDACLTPADGRGASA